MNPQGVARASFLPDRRAFLRQLTSIVGGPAMAYGLLPLSGAREQIVAKDDPRLHTAWIEYPGPKERVRAYLARPVETKKRPEVIVSPVSPGQVTYVSGRESSSGTT